MNSQNQSNHIIGCKIGFHSTIHPKQSFTKGQLEESHYDDVIMGAIASQITNLRIVYSTIYSDADQRKHQSSAPLAFVRGIHRGPVNSPHKWPVTRKMFPFDDVIMYCEQTFSVSSSLWYEITIGVKCRILATFHVQEGKKIS